MSLPHIIHLFINNNKILKIFNVQLLCAYPALIQPLEHRVNDVDRASALMELYNGRKRIRSKFKKKKTFKNIEYLEEHYFEKWGKEWQGEGEEYIFLIWRLQKNLWHLSSNLKDKMSWLGKDGGRECWVEGTASAMILTWELTKVKTKSQWEWEMFLDEVREK